MSGRKDCGLTMIELLAAMAILATLGGFLVQILGTSFDLFDQGEARGSLGLTAQATIEALQEDLTAVHGGPSGRLIIEPDRLGPGSMLIRLVRTLPGGEADHPVLRRAATGAQPTETWSGADSGAAPSILPPSGLIEVMWALVQDPRDPVGVLSLWRGVQAPALEGPQSFFSEASEEALNPDSVRERLAQVSGNILGLWVLSLAQRARDWQEEVALSGRPASDGATPTFDSTRGFLDRARFPLARGRASFLDERDDIFPRQVRIVLAVTRAERPETALASRLAEEEARLTVRTDRRLPPEESADRLVKVRNEWLQLSGSGGRIGVSRAQRNSRATSEHPAGTPVYVGHHFRATFSLPAARSYWIEGDR